MTVKTRLFPPDADVDWLRRQWAVGPDERRGTVMLMRWPAEDVAASDHIGGLVAGSETFVAGVAEAWSLAQLAADATMLGMGLGARVVLVPERGRWYADLLVVQTRGRLRIGRGSADARRALTASRRILLRSGLGDGSQADGAPSSAAPVPNPA